MSAFRRAAIATLRQARRWILFVVGSTVVLVGVVLIFVPGPASLVIPVGLGILAVEFAWARRLLRRFKVQLRRAARKGRALAKGPRGGSGSSAPGPDDP